MSNSGITLVKVVMLAGGAVIGTLLARWVDGLLEAQGEEHSKQSEFDRNRYAQGLTANSQAPQGPPQTPFQVMPEETQQKEQFE